MICLGSVPGIGIDSKFLINMDSQCLVDLSSCKHDANVVSRNWSGRHWRNASHAL